jgi:O-antigen/teichoic acid export membrane protein
MGTGLIVLQGSGTLTWLLIARILPPEEMGSLGLIMQAVLAIGVPAGFGLGVTATRLLAADLSQTRARLASTTRFLLLMAGAISTGVALAAALLAPWIAGSILGNKDLTDEFQLSLVLLILNALFGVLSGSLLGLMATRQLSWMNVGRGALQLCCGVSGAALGGIPGALAGFILGTGASLAVGARLLLETLSGLPQNHLRPSSRPVRADVMWAFSLPVVLSALLTDPVMWLGNSYLAHQAGGHADVAIIVAANSWKSVIMFGAGVVSTALLPRLTNICRTGDPHSYSAILLRSAGSSLLLAGIPALLIAGLADPILSWYGAAYAGESLTLRLLALASVLAAVNVTLGNGFVAAGRMYLGLACNTLWAAVFLWCAGAWVHIGPQGLAFAYVAAYAVHTVAQTVCLFLEQRTSTPLRAGTL